MSHYQIKMSSDQTSEDQMDSYQTSDDQAKALNIHNNARREANAHGHSRPALVWDTKLANNALAYAQVLAKRNTGLEHSSGSSRPGQGENLFWSSVGASLATASQDWVAESKYYHGEPIGQGDFHKYGHYTQIIWPTTTRVGIAAVRSSSGGTYIVARYSPVGNITGRSAY